MIRTVVTRRRLFHPNQTQEPPETSISGKDLRQAEGDSSKRGLIAVIMACPNLGCHSRSLHTALISRRSSSRSASTCQSNGDSPQRCAYTRHSLCVRAGGFRLQITATGSGGKRLTVSPAVVRYPLIIQMTMTLWHVTSLVASTCTG